MLAHYFCSFFVTTSIGRFANARSLSRACFWIALCGCGQSVIAAPQMPPPPQVSVAEPIARKVTAWDEFTGHIEAKETVEIRPRIAGYLDKVLFTEGAEVKKGDRLFLIDPRPYQAKLAQAQAELARARARARLTRVQADRVGRLLGKNVVSKDEADERVAADAQAQADIHAAEAAVQSAQLELNYTDIRSPIHGRVGRALVTQGNVVSGGEMVPNATLLTTVVMLDPVYVFFDGDEQAYLRFGAAARVKGAAPSAVGASSRVTVGLANEEGFPHPARLNFVDNRLDATTGSIRVRAELDNPERLFTPGLFARVKLMENTQIDALLVDDKAVLTDQDRKYVYVLGPGNTALRKDIKTGRIEDGFRVVMEGLAAGDRVIVHGVQKIFFPGMPVTPQPIAMGAPPPMPAGPPGAEPAPGH